MVEPRLEVGMMAIAKREQESAVGIEHQDLTRITVGEPDAVVRTDEHAMRIGERTATPRADNGAVGRQDDDGRIAALEHIDLIL
jgi:hypothetical protein